MPQDYVFLSEDPIARLLQLADSLRSLEIGLEWYSALVRQELARAGW